MYSVDFFHFDEVPVAGRLDEFEVLLVRHSMSFPHPLAVHVTGKLPHFLLLANQH